MPEILVATNVVSGAFTDRHSVIAFFGIVFVLPVSLLKDLSKLAYTSLASVCSIGVLRWRARTDRDFRWTERGQVAHAEIGHVGMLRVRYCVRGVALTGLLMRLKITPLGFPMSAAV